jgi:hypothetical protein
MSELSSKKLKGKDLEALKALLIVLPRYVGINPFTDFHLDILKAINPKNASQSDYDTIESLTFTYEGYLNA